MEPTPSSTRSGILAAFGTFLCWGLFGLYFKALGEVPAPEVLAHRVLGGAVFAVILLVAVGGLKDLRPLMADRSALLRLGGSALAIAVNWGLFVWSVAHGRALEASLGYYIYPLVSVLLGRVLLGEHMSRRQTAAVVLVALGVGWQVSHGTGVPWVALGLAASFGVYGLLRKTIAVPALAGLLVETVWLTPLAALYLVWEGGGVAPALGGHTLVLLALAGPVTAVPLALFAYGARRLRLSTIGLMMYMNPTVQMLVAVFALGEAFTSAHAVTFAAIWAGVALYAWPLRKA
ncbi:MAG TPA: EamA family transporter RarD [Magnetospirillum sp.]|jgi:chloramphenicol-sensitive protein RarD|nr:EamA family transporter RarD [Magnetospirillum sp.]